MAGNRCGIFITEIQVGGDKENEHTFRQPALLNILLFLTSVFRAARCKTFKKKNKWPFKVSMSDQTP